MLAGRQGLCAMHCAARLPPEFQTLTLSLFLSLSPSLPLCSHTLPASNLSALTLPTSVAGIAEDAFSSCSALAGLLIVPT